MHANDDHEWTFAFRTNGWAAACACGIGAVITEQPDGRQHWQWRKDGMAVPPAHCAGAVESLRAQLQHVVFTSVRPGKN